MTPEEARTQAVVARIAEPAHVKIMKGPGGRYDYELSYHNETMDGALNTILKAKAQLEVELYSTVQIKTGGTA